MVEVLKFTYLLCIFIIWNEAKVHSLSRNHTTRNTPSHYKFKTNSTVPTSRVFSKISGKWQVGRVSRKQYEIINMLHRKTIIFSETENTFVTTRNSIKLSKQRGVFNTNKQHITVPLQKPLNQSFQAVHPRPNQRPMTPSYIEFYYLDDSDDRVKQINSMQKNSRTALQSDEYKFALLRPPFFLFRVNDATCKPVTLNYKTSSFYNNQHFSSNNLTPSTLVKIDKSKEKHYVQQRVATKNMNRIEVKHKTNITENKKLDFIVRDRFTPLYTKTPYDRIKFFEIYDSDTYKPRSFIDDKMNVINNNNIHSQEKIYLDQVDHNTDNQDSNNISRYVKKHANYNFEETENPVSQVDKTSNNTSKMVETTGKTLKKRSRRAKWSDFPFIAVYVYEPMQVRCDSASISRHWLVASAICLYRHYMNPISDTEQRSAFVTYCGDNWRLSERIAYVKRAFIHPRFQEDRSRRHLYNIGVIQVVNSMASTCSGWRPVSLMSHQFAADPDGSFATAVGWGLDRYDTRYRHSSDLPSHALMLYEGLVYSDSCPGNADYRVKMLNGESVKNVYCLSLPRYALEKNDTVHGGLLLIGGKLIALYLQEENPSWGVQSALYTGIWRLVPWVLDVSREVQDLQIFT